MKASVRRFKSLEIGLKELERFIRNGGLLPMGLRFKGLGGMLFREAWANWLMCATISFQSGRPFYFTSDPDPQGDGIIYDTVNDRPWPTEHVLVPQARPGETRDIDTLILDAVQKKESRGAAYASGKTLIVFLYAALGEWKPSVVARKLPPGNFENVWVVGLHGEVKDGAYTYGVACLRTGLDSRIGAPVWLVRIDKTFESWKVDRLQ